MFYWFLLYLFINNILLPAPDYFILMSKLTCYFCIRLASLRLSLTENMRSRNSKLLILLVNLWHIYDSNIIICSYNNILKQNSHISCKYYIVVFIIYNLGCILFALNFANITADLNILIKLDIYTNTFNIIYYNINFSHGSNSPLYT